jgi:hypothetical protein
MVLCFQWDDADLKPVVRFASTFFEQQTHYQIELTQNLLCLQ